MSPCRGNGADCADYLRAGGTRDRTRSDELCLALMRKAPWRIPHAEAWSNPDAETYLTGIDYYEHPRLCRKRLRELYPQLDLPIPDRDDPQPPPVTDPTAEGSWVDRDGLRHVRWGDGETTHWDWGRRFSCAEDVLAFSPLEQADFTDIPVVESEDFSSEETIFRRYRRNYPAEWGSRGPEGVGTAVSFYNTMFMWPLLTFGWELFLATCLDEGFARIMDEFAEINRRVFRAFARLPVNFVFCHDDIVTSRGPVCPPSWMRRFIFSRYEELWDIVRSTGKQVIFQTDGNIDAYAEDIFACGAIGIQTEPYTDFKAIARRHGDSFLSGEGDVRVLLRNNPAEIEAMVKSMVDTAYLSRGYAMGIGNHIPWNVPPQAVKRYLDLCVELAHR